MPWNNSSGYHNGFSAGCMYTGKLDWVTIISTGVLTHKKLGHFFSTCDFIINVVYSRCIDFLWNKSKANNIWSVLLVLMVWCFSIRASVATVSAEYALMSFQMIMGQYIMVIVNQETQCWLQGFISLSQNPYQKTLFRETDEIFKILLILNWKDGSFIFNHPPLHQSLLFLSGGCHKKKLCLESVKIHQKKPLNSSQVWLGVI